MKKISKSMQKELTDLVAIPESEADGAILIARNRT
jgi:hypothetical protein